MRRNNIFGIDYLYAGYGVGGGDYKKPGMDTPAPGKAGKSEKSEKSEGGEPSEEAKVLKFGDSAVLVPRVTDTKTGKDLYSIEEVSEYEPKEGAKEKKGDAEIPEGPKEKKPAEAADKPKEPKADKPKEDKPKKGGLSINTAVGNG